jgi:serine/threonine protein kinase
MSILNFESTLKGISFESFSKRIGGTSTVYFVGDYAVKIFDVDGFIDNETNINNVIDSSDIDKRYILVMKPYKYNDIDCLIGPKMKCNAYQMANNLAGYCLVGILIEQIYSALIQIHTLGICHRDVTLTNILFDGIKFYLSDFGHSMICDTYDISSTCSQYEDPRPIKDKYSDYYSLAICIKLFLGVKTVRRSHFNESRHWKLFLNLSKSL